MTAQVDDSRHPVVDTVVDLRSVLSELSRTPVWSLSTADTEAALVEAQALATQVAQLQLRLLAHAERVDVGGAVGATSPANWLAHETRTTRAAAHRAKRLATSLDEAHPAVDQALATAAINVEQAHVIVEAVVDLPDTIGADVVAQAEAFLVAEAADHDAKALRVLGRRLLEVLDPDAAEAEEARRLAAEEAEARATASFTMSDDGHGKVHGRFSIPSAHGSMLRKALLALAAPARNPDRPENTPTRHALGLAFVEYLETRPEDTLPSAGGVSATVVVTMTLESLMGGLKAAGLCDGTRISASEARRLACRAGVIPVVLGGKSQPLDIGRKGRFHTKPQRIALGLRDGGCNRDRLRPATLALPRPPRHPLEQRRQHQHEERTPALLPPSPPRPRPRLRHHRPARQQDHLPPQVLKGTYWRERRVTPRTRNARGSKVAGAPLEERGRSHGPPLHARPTVMAAGLAGCGSDSEARPGTGADADPSAETTTQDPQGSREPILIRTRIMGFSGEVEPGSTLGGHPFCRDGTVRHEPGSPEIGYPAVNVFECPDGQLQVGFGPGPDQMDNAVQTSTWEVLEGSGDFAGMGGEGRMKVRFARPGASKGRETFRGTVLVP